MLKKVTLGLVLLSLLSVPSLASDRTANNLFGPVRSVEVSEAPVVEKFGEPVIGEPSLKYTYAYDAAGNLVMEEWPNGETFKTDGEQFKLMRKTRVFDEQGRITRQAWFAILNDVPRKEVTTTYFAGRIESVEESTAYLSPFKIITTLNAREQPTDISRYDKWGDLVEKTVCKYDALGRPTEEVTYNDKGETTIKTVYSYETNVLGTTTTKTVYDKTGEQRMRRITRLDEKGRPVFEEQYGDYDPEEDHPSYWRYFDMNLQTRFARSYGSDGRLLWKGTFGKDYRTLSEIFTHDSKGNLILRESYNPDFPENPERRRFTYEFDSHGNWTVRIESSWVTKFGESYFEPLRATLRKIDYFE